MRGAGHSGAGRMAPLRLGMALALGCPVALGWSPGGFPNDLGKTPPRGWRSWIAFVHEADRGSCWPSSGRLSFLQLMSRAIKLREDEMSGLSCAHRLLVVDLFKMSDEELWTRLSDFACDQRPFAPTDFAFPRSVVQVRWGQCNLRASEFI